MKESETTALIDVRGTAATSPTASAALAARAPVTSAITADIRTHVLRPSPRRTTTTAAGGTKTTAAPVRTATGTNAQITSPIAATSNRTPSRGAANAIGSESLKETATGTEITHVTETATPTGTEKAASAGTTAETDGIDAVVPATETTLGSERTGEKIGAREGIAVVPRARKTGTEAKARVTSAIRRTGETSTSVESAAISSRVTVSTELGPRG